MIEWMYLFTAVLLFGIVNFLRKILMRGIETSEAPFWEALGFIPAMVIVFLTIPIVLSTDFLLLCIASAVFVSLAVIMLYRALQDGYVSIVTAVANLNTHLSAFLALIIFTEPFSFRLIFGILLAASVIILLTKSKTVKPGKWLGFSILSLLFFALKNLVDKTLSVGYDPLSAFAVISFISLFVYFVPFALGKRTASNKVILKLAGNGVLISIAFASLFMAFSLVPLSIAAPVAGMNMLVTALLGVYFLKEKLDRRAWIAIVIALVSIWLLAG